MKRTLVILVGLMCLLLSACRPTLKQGMVINKKDGNNLVTAKPNNASFSAVPQKWTEKFEYYGGKLKVNVDADLLAPQNQTWPVYEVKLANYTQEEVDFIIKALCGDAKLYDQSGLTSKAELEKQLLEARLELQQRENGTYTGNGDHGIEDLRRTIKRLQQQIPKAPENSGTREISTRLTYDERFDADFLFASMKSGQLDGASIDIRSGRNLPYSENRITFSNGASFDVFNRLTEDHTY